MYTNDNIMGKVSFATVSGKEIDFIVFDDYNMMCESYSLGKIINRIIVKPNFIICFDDGTHTSLDEIRRKEGSPKNYATGVFCDEDLLDELLVRKLITYSMDMSYLYGLDEEYAYDKQYQKRSFKRVKDDDKVLSKQKKGIFN